MGSRIAIMGTGAVGGYAGAHMAQAGEDVTFIDPWPAHVEHMKKHGLRVTHANARGEYNRVFTVTSTLPGVERDELQQAIATLSADAVGAIGAMVKATVDYAKTRVQFGQPIANFQALQHRMVRMRIKEEEARARAAGDLPSCALLRVEPFLHEVAVELLRADVDAPALAVDDHADVIRLRRGHVVLRDFGVEHRAYERRIVVGVQQVEGLVSAEVGFVVDEVEPRLCRHLHEERRRVGPGSSSLRPVALGRSAGQEERWNRARRQDLASERVTASKGSNVLIQRYGFVN